MTPPGNGNSGTGPDRARKGSAARGRGRLGGRLLPLVFLLAAGCAEKTPREEAREVLNAVYESMERGDFQGTLKHYSPTFLATTPPEKWIGILQQLQRSYGDFETYEILQTTDRRDGGGDPATHVIFQCRARYEKDSILQELVLVRPAGADRFTIKGHSINLMLPLRS